MRTINDGNKMKLSEISPNVDYLPNENTEEDLPDHHYNYGRIVPQISLFEANENYPQNTYTKFRLSDQLFHYNILFYQLLSISVNFTGFIYLYINKFIITLVKLYMELSNKFVLFNDINEGFSF